jgi:hypothetical protein
MLPPVERLNRRDVRLRSGCGETSGGARKNRGVLTTKGTKPTKKERKGGDR